jgi:uncharacterized protein YbgA (DUF1722 family)
MCQLDGGNKMKLFERIHKLGMAKGWNKTEHAMKLGIFQPRKGKQPLKASLNMYKHYLTKGKYLPHHILLNIKDVHSLTDDDILRMSK